MRTKDWFSVLLFVLGLVLSVLIFRAYGEQIRLEWDQVENVDGYYLYHSQRDSTFHYDIPITTELYPDGKIPQNITRLEVNLPGIEGRNTRYRFVARSFRGDEQSIDSNEVEYYVALVPPPPAVELAGSYDKAEGVVNVSWEQPAEDYEYLTVSHWIVYYRVGDAEWTAVGRTDAGGELTMTAPFAAVQSGEQADVDFVVVSYRRSGVYSANSNILTLTIDRRNVPPIQNLRINIEIPVE